ncbi:cytochrome c oxidase subunit 5A, mitochondrial [Monosporozyma unispora]|nr:Cytochrome c oxidase subunit 5A [Kazachstania unispora]
MMLRNTLTRISVNSALPTIPIRCAHVQAISKASIDNLQGRWEKMAIDEQEDIVTKLTERQKLPWKNLTNTEKQASWYISYGAWGPRKPVLEKGDGVFIAKGVILGLVVSFATFAFFRSMGGEDVKSMNKEWQMKSDEYLKSKNANPWGGYSQVQSK